MGRSIHRYGTMETGGRLRRGTLAGVLSSLAQDRHTGVLVVSNEKVVKRVYLDQGWVVHSASTDPNEGLRSQVLRQGLVDEDTLEVAQEIHLSDGLSLGMTLLELGAMSEEQLAPAIRLSVEETICDLVSWTEGEFYFVPGERSHLCCIPVKVDVADIVLQDSPCPWLSEDRENKPSVSSPEPSGLAAAFIPTDIIVELDLEDLVVPPP